MLSSLLVLAQTTGHAVEAAAAHGGEAATGITKITQDFGINLPGIIAQVFSFCVVAFVLYKAAFKPVLATLDERQAKIESGLKYSEEMKAKLEAAHAESAAIVKAAQIEGTKAVEEARKSAKEFLDRQTQEASAKAAEMLTKAQHAIELERRKMVAEARSEIARLVVTTTQQVLAQELSADDRSRYNAAAAKALQVA